MQKILIINGPNLNKLGKREPEIYGTRSFEGYLEELRKEFSEINFDYFQSNIEGEIIDKLQEAEGQVDGIVFNGAGYTHTSVSIADALAAMKTPVVEVHISNIHNREQFRERSLTGKHAAGVITGFGLTGYKLALLYLLNR